MTEIYGINAELLFSDKARFEAVYQSLPAERRIKIDRYQFDKDKRLSLGAGYLLQYAVKDWGYPLEQTIRLGEFGKPYFTDIPIYFSLSHSGRIAVCAISDQEIGIDMEEKKRCSEKVVTYLLTDREKEERQSSAISLWEYWTAKEASLKLLGTGFYQSPKELELEGASWQMRTSLSNKSIFLKGYDWNDYFCTLASYEEQFPDQIKWVRG